MARFLLRLLAVMLLATSAAPPVSAQAGVGRKQQERIQRKKQKNDKVDVKKEEKRLLKEHLSRQDKKTRKRMKYNRRQADRKGQAGRRDPFLRRLFGSRH